MAVGGSSRLTWPEAHNLVMALGREDYLAERIETERRARGWSQERLAVEMTEAGCPLPQSAISKIEKPARGGRRAITVEEAIAFSRVLDIPLVELVLPAEAMGNATILKDLADGPGLLRAATSAQEHYRQVVDRLAKRMAGDAFWTDRLADELERALEDVAEQGREPGDSVKVRFLWDVAAAVKS